MADEEDFSSLPLLERVQHKIWNVRLGAYEEAAKNFRTSSDENAACVKPFLNDPGLWKKIVTDSNAAAQEAGMGALAAFLEYGGPNACVKTRGTVISAVVEKGLSSMKAGTKQKATDCILLYVELDTPDPVLEELITFVSHKLPKLVSATLSVIKELYRLFGAKTVSPKPVIKILPKAFGHADKNVRAEASNIAVELYKWIGDSIKPVLLNDLKPVQQKELEELFEKVKSETPHQERMLRSQQQEQSASTSEPEHKQGVNEEVKMDAFDFMEPVDVLGKLRREHKDFDEMLASTKWKDRKEALDSLNATASVSRIANDDFGSITNQLAKIVEKDANVMVVLTAANCIETLAKGLRGSFGQFHSILPNLMERLKERKQNVIDAIVAACDATFACTTSSDILDDLVPFLAHKNPQCKLESIKFLTRCLSTTPLAPNKAETKSLADAILKALNDTSAPVRDAAAEALGTLMKIQGERAMAPFLENVDDIRKNKIKHAFDAAKVSAKPYTAATTAPKISNLDANKAVTKKPPGASAAARGQDGKTTGRSIRSLATAQSKIAPSKAGIKRVASPTRRPGEPDEQSKPSSRTGLAGRGLTSRPLSASVPSSQLADHGTISAQERQELEALRAETVRLKQAAADDRAEKSRLLAEINDLQLKLIEDHTRNVLSVKAKETQLTRARAEADAVKSQLQRTQKELEHAQLSRSSPSSPPPAGKHESFTQGTDLDSVLSHKSPFGTEEKENLGEGENHADSWRRAAEVTHQLKARIEQMKARQNMSKNV